jgi:hypothetical protein
MIYLTMKKDLSNSRNESDITKSPPTEENQSPSDSSRFAGGGASV